MCQNTVIRFTDLILVAITKNRIKTGKHIQNVTFAVHYFNYTMNDRDEDAIKTKPLGADAADIKSICFGQCKR